MKQRKEELEANEPERQARAILIPTALLEIKGKDGQRGSGAKKKKYIGKNAKEDATAALIDSEREYKRGEKCGAPPGKKQIGPD